jgi:hypothetical protein
MKNSAYYTRLAGQVTEFRDAYLVVLSHLRPVTDGLLNKLAPKQGSEDEAAKAIAIAATLAGATKLAQQESGIDHVYVVPMVGVAMDPVTGWGQSLSDPQAMPPSGLLADYNAMIGALQAKAAESAVKEKTLAGRLARVIGFPSQVRSYLSDLYPGQPKLAVAGFVAGIVLELAIATVAAVAATGMGLWLWPGSGSVSSGPGQPRPSPTVSVTTVSPGPAPSHT